MTETFEKYKTLAECIWTGAHDNYTDDQLEIIKHIPQFSYEIAAFNGRRWLDAENYFHYDAFSAFYYWRYFELYRIPNKRAENALLESYAVIENHYAFTYVNTILESDEYNKNPFEWIEAEHIIDKHFMLHIKYSTATKKRVVTGEDNLINIALGDYDQYFLDSILTYARDVIGHRWMELEERLIRCRNVVLAIMYNIEIKFVWQELRELLLQNLRLESEDSSVKNIESYLTLVNDSEWPEFVASMKAAMYNGQQSNVAAKLMQLYKASLHE